MGAWYDEITVVGGNEKYVLKKFKEEQDTASYEDGNSYSGRLNMAPGIEFTNKIFKNHEQATKFLQENCLKWENAKVCKYFNNKGQLVWLIGAMCSC